MKSKVVKQNVNYSTFKTFEVIHRIDTFYTFILENVFVFVLGSREHETQFKCVCICLGSREYETQFKCVFIWFR